jgi:hypothetical protein
MYRTDLRTSCQKSAISISGTNLEEKGENDCKKVPASFLIDEE